MSILAAIVFAGVFSYSGAPLELDPDVAVPVIFVLVPHEGISPEDSERLLARPMEIELRKIEGVEEISAYAGEGNATLVIEFDSSFDQDQAVTDVREAVDRAKAEIPSTAEEPIIREVSVADFPVLTIGVSGRGVPDRVRNRIARQIKDEVETIPDVLEARLAGSREELLEAVIDPAQLQAYGIANEELLSVVGRNNRLIAAGSVNTGRGSFSIKIPGVLESAQDLLAIPIKASAEGAVTLADVVSLRRTFKDAESFTRTNGVPAVVVNVSKRPGTSIVDVVAQVRARVDALTETAPANVEISYLNDQTEFTLDVISTLEGNISTAMVLVLTIVVAAVGLRAGLLVAFSIPVSFMFAFIVMNLLDYTYNFMTMFGMLLGLGMLIDGAIVVAELAERRLREGASPRAAYLYATRRMLMPVLASTATTLAAFLPLMFWPGVTGEFMKYLPVTVFAVLAGALVYALLFAPVIGVMAARQRPAAGMTASRLVDTGRFHELTGLTGWYAGLLHFCTRHPFLVILATLAGLYAVVAAYGAYGKGSRYFVDVEPSMYSISVAAKGNYSVQELSQIVSNVEARVGARGDGYVDNIYSQAGAGELSFGQSGSTADRIGSLFVILTDRRERDADGFEMERRYIGALEGIPGVRAEVHTDDGGPPVGKDIQIQLTGTHLPVLARETRRLSAHLAQMPGLIAVDDTAPVPGIEWQVTVDRAKAAMAGADISSIGAAIQLVTNGVLVGKYRPDDAEDEVDIRVRYPAEHRSASQLDQLRVSTREGQVPISSFVQRDARPKVSSIFRQNGKRAMYVRANAEPGVLPNDKLTEISDWLEAQQFDDSVNIAFRGANEEQQKTNDFIGVAFTLALMLMGILLVTQFNSFYQALLILSSVVMSTIGVLLGLLVTGQAFSAIMTGIGIVALAGIVVNNNIVLIDTYNHLKREHPNWGMQRVIIAAGCQRLRPVLLTTFTTGFGLLPMASGLSIDLIGQEVEVGGPVASYWNVLASAIVSGLTFATLLTLVVTPACLMAPHALKRMFGGGRRAPGPALAPAAR